MSYAEHAFGWKELLISMGTMGILMLLVDAVMIGIFVHNLAKRQWSWMPLWFGGVCVVAGILGTIFGVVETYSIIASKGGAASPVDLSEGVAKSLICSAVGFGSMLLALVFTGILHAFRHSEVTLHDEGCGPSAGQK